MKIITLLCNQATDGNFFIEYGSGAVYGDTVYDSLRLASPTITLQRQGFGLVNSASATFVVASCDGLFVSGPISQTCWEANAD